MRTAHQARDLVRAMNLPEPTTEEGWTHAVITSELLLDLARTMPSDLLGKCDVPFMMLLAGRCPFCRHPIAQVRVDLTGLHWRCSEGCDDRGQP